MKLTSKPLIAALPVTAAAIMLPTIALASTSSGAAPQHPAATAPACGNAHPERPGGAFVWASLPGDSFAGGIGYVMEITNVDRQACSLRGIPGAAVQSGGHLIGSQVPASGKGPLITLKPGATAHLSLTIHNASALCRHQVAGQVVIYLPGQRLSQSGSLNAQARPGLRGGGVLGPAIIQPSAGISLYNL